MAASKAAELLGSARDKLGFWDAHLKLKFIGSWWKIDLVTGLAKMLGLEVELYTGGTGRGDL